MIDETHCSTLQHTATHRSSLQQIATRHSLSKRGHIASSILQRTATHCNTLQHTATHCNTLNKCHTPQCLSQRGHIASRRGSLALSRRRLICLGRWHSWRRWRRRRWKSIRRRVRRTCYWRGGMSCLWPGWQVVDCLRRMCCSVLQCDAVCSSVLHLRRGRQIWGGFGS